YPAPPSSSPLPLPDALPIFVLHALRGGGQLPRLPDWDEPCPEVQRDRRAEQKPARFDRHDPRDPCAPVRIGHLLDRLTEQRRIRSEEHTSELQSHLNLVCRL